MVCTDCPSQLLTPLALVSRQGTRREGAGSLSRDSATPHPECEEPVSGKKTAGVLSKRTFDRGDRGVHAVFMQ